MKKEDVKKMIKSLNQDIVYEDDTSIEIENVYAGETIIFKFNCGGDLIEIGC